MTRKDYVLIAGSFNEAIAALKDQKERLTNQAQKEICQHQIQGVSMAAFVLADALANDNPRFERERFLKASGVA